MSVVENDNVVQGMLKDELDRCKEALDALNNSIASLPKGVLLQRIKRYKEKEYHYYYLKYRQGNEAVSKHVPEEEREELARKLVLRRQYENEARSYIKRIAYLRHVLGKSDKPIHGIRDKE
jgi:hypothetical protein